MNPDQNHVTPIEPSVLENNPDASVQSPFPEQAQETVVAPSDTASTEEVQTPAVEPIPAENAPVSQPETVIETSEAPIAPSDDSVKPEDVSISPSVDSENVFPSNESHVFDADGVEVTVFTLESDGSDFAHKAAEFAKKNNYFVK